MKISKLLLAIEHNKYLLVYETIIENAQMENRKKGKDVYYELHHIIPKSILPEYTDLTKHKWNGVLLTPKEHFIVHRLLCKFTTGKARITSLRAYNAVCHKTRRATGHNPTSLQYRKAREAAAIAGRAMVRGSRCPKWATDCNDLNGFKERLVSLNNSGMSDPEIGKLYGVSAAAIHSWRGKLSIQKRRQSLKDRDYLYTEYVVKKRPMLDIAEELNCTATAVSQYLRKFKIDCRFTNMKWENSPVYDREWLKEQIEIRTMNDIAAEIGCSRPTVKNMLKKFGLIPPKKT